MVCFFLQVLFWSIKTNGELDRGSLHGACPVIAGVKWSAPKWFHVGPYGHGKRVEHKVFKPPAKQPRGDCSNPAAASCCRDTDERCEGWAVEGECTKNPLFMVGGAGSAAPGACRLSCGACPSADPEL